jgi:hypothetical protein
VNDPAELVLQKGRKAERAALQALDKVRGVRELRVPTDAEKDASAGTWQLRSHAQHKKGRPGTLGPMAGRHGEGHVTIGDGDRAPADAYPQHASRQAKAEAVPLFPDLFFLSVFFLFYIGKNLSLRIFGDEFLISSRF